jgi:hypothetical protein
LQAGVKKLKEAGKLYTLPQEVICNFPASRDHETRAYAVVSVALLTASAAERASIAAAGNQRPESPFS